jgi:hypothetical protein
MFIPVCRWQELGCTPSAYLYRGFMPIRACLVRALHKLPVQSRPSLHSQKKHETEFLNKQNREANQLDFTQNFSTLGLTYGFLSQHPPPRLLFDIRKRWMKKS